MTSIFSLSSKLSGKRICCNLWSFSAIFEDTDPDGWKQLLDVDFFSFLETLGEENMLSKNVSSVMDNIYRKIKQGITMDPLDAIGTLIIYSITCTREQLKIIDDLTQQHKNDKDQL